MSASKTFSAGVLLGLCTQSWASGFAVTGNSTSSLGHAFAGNTTVADDATVVRNNPALMQSLDGDQVSVALHGIIPGVQYDDDGSNTTGGNSEHIDTVHIIPNFYYLKDLGEGVRFGVAVYTPFGLGLEYDKDWVGRYHTTESELRTINISPAFSFKASDKLNLGVGIDVQYIEAELSNAIDFGPAGDGKQTLTGDNWAMGYSLGMTYDFNKTTRMGVVFHSATRHDVRGTSEFDNVPSSLAFAFSDTNADLTLMLPESLSVGFRHSLTPRLDLLADYTWTRWSRYDALVVNFENEYLPTSRTEQNWEDVPRYSVGMNYRWKDDWLLRAGASYDLTPVPDAEHRSPRIPDSDKLTLGAGSKFMLNDRLDLDTAITYTVPSKAKINNTDSLGHTLKGEYEVDTSYLSVMLSWKL